MGLEKDKPSLPVWQRARHRSPIRRMTWAARQHSPLVTFVAFALLVLLFMHLPWSHKSFQLPHSFQSTMDNADEIAVLNRTMDRGHGTLTIRPNSTLHHHTPKFAKIAVASGFEDILYEKALQTHIDHAQKWGYPLYMARESAADGMFNKVAHILNVLLNELYKPADERVEWLLYVVHLQKELPSDIIVTLTSTPSS